jgi:hypothetical protein
MIHVPSIAVQTAFVAIASRLVGSTFRVLETLNPELQKSKVISDPKVVFKREAITMGLAWVFALLTNMAIDPMATRRGWNRQLITFLTAVAGTLISETISRFVSYRNAVRKTDVKTIVPPAEKEITPTPLMQQSTIPVLQKPLVRRTNFYPRITQMPWITSTSWQNPYAAYSYPYGYRY